MRIQLLSFLITTLFYQVSMGQSFEVPAHSLRMAAPAEIKYVKEVILASSDSTLYYYYQTHYSELNWQGEINRRITMDTAKSGYISTTYWQTGPDNELLFQYTVDTTTSDTLDDVRTLRTATGMVRVSKTMVNNQFQNYTKRIVTDSAGYAISDSTFIWNKSGWRYAINTRNFFTFQGDQITSRIFINKDSTGAQNKFLSMYTYQDTTLQKIEYYLYDEARQTWTFYSYNKYHYLDEYGSVADSTPGNVTINFYGPDKKYKGYEKKSFDTSLQKWKLSGYSRNTFDEEGKISEMNIFYQPNTWYKQLITYPAALPVLSASTSLKESDIALYPNPAKENIYINLPKDIVLETVILKNALGQILFTQSGANNSIPVSAITPGVYLIEVKTNKGVIHKNILID